MCYAGEVSEVSCAQSITRLGNYSGNVTAQLNARPI